MHTELLASQNNHKNIVPRFGIKRKRPKNSEIFPIKSKVASAKSNSNVL